MALVLHRIARSGESEKEADPFKAETNKMDSSFEPNMVARVIEGTL
jgi:hypothetical protein